jgi:hypothetical protein
MNYPLSLAWSQLCPYTYTELPSTCCPLFIHLVSILFIHYDCLLYSHIPHAYIFKHSASVLLNGHLPFLKHMRPFKAALKALRPFKCAMCHAD